tara:strand:- start:35 stop:274 length:240 start_codon:yes stop_codon:yes gene_type:complete
MSKISENGIIRDATAEEQAEIDARKIEWNNNKAQRDLEHIYTERKRLYGSWESQLDEIFHDIEAWKTRIQKIKTENPKS